MKKMTQMETMEQYVALRRLLRESDKGATPRARAVAVALKAGLTERQRQMIWLYYAEQLTMRDIARLLELNPSTVSRTIKAAKQRLKIALLYTGLFEGEED